MKNLLDRFTSGALSAIGGIGRAVMDLGAHTFKVYNLLVETIRWVVIGPFKKKFVKSDAIFSQMVFTGVESLIIAFFVAMFTGVVIAMQTAPQLATFGGTVYVASLVAVSIARELGPVLTALVVAGRVGSAMTAELGTMKVSEQIEALETIALNPVRFLVVPRFLALCVMLPCLTIIADFAGIIGGFIVGVFSLHISPALYIDVTFRFLTAKDVTTGLVKAFVFAVTIAMIACYKGLNTKGGAEGVGKSTTQSVVISFILIILFDCILTGIFYFTKV
ncbi:MAG: ABC transporter permease [Candidatus Omnitrophica bacterium]|nr:ABC transporter permease [Candidatus Omnitrophota bacterium]